MPQRLLNKVAVVTGASGELGRAVVERFLAEGAKVVVFGRNRGRLDELSGLAAARVLVVDGDVTRLADLEGLAATTVRRFGGVDILVPAAALFRIASLAESTPELVSDLFAVNLQGALQTVRVFERHLNAGASIVFVTTATATGGGSLAGLGPFAASKAALTSLARTLAVEFAPRGIRVNCVAPQSGLDQANAGRSEGERAESSTAFPIRNRGNRHMETVAETILFVASDSAAGITGQELIVDAPR
jgi:NAD(P)-dependent dehydrogenase (short-subunit alcohol dehydrogenase family)